MFRVLPFLSPPRISPILSSFPCRFHCRSVYPFYAERSGSPPEVQRSLGRGTIEIGGHSTWPDHRQLLMPTRNSEWEPGQIQYRSVALPDLIDRSHRAANNVQNDRLSDNFQPSNRFDRSKTILDATRLWIKCGGRLSYSGCVNHATRDGTAREVVKFSIFDRSLRLRSNCGLLVCTWFARDNGTRKFFHDRSRGDISGGQRSEEESNLYNYLEPSVTALKPLF